MINDCGCENLLNNTCPEDPVEVNTVTCSTNVVCKVSNWTKCIIYDGADLGCAVVIGGVATFTSDGSAGDTGAYTITGLTATGGNGIGAIFSVSGNLIDTDYGVVVTTPGTGYEVGDTLIIAGSSIQPGFTSPANDVTITVSTLSTPINSIHVQIEPDDTLNDIIENLNDRICNLTPEGMDYSGFDYQCLRADGTLISTGDAITTAQEFVEAISIALCAINTRLIAIEVPDVDPGCLALSGGETLVEVLDTIIAKECEIDEFLMLPIVVNNSCFTSEPGGTDPISDWFQWIIDNTCAISTAVTTSISTQTTRINNINTYLHGTNNPSYPITYNISCMGGSTTANVNTTITTLITEVCSLATDIAALPDLDAIILPWATCFSGSPYTYTSAAQTLQTHLGRFLNVVSREKITFSSDFSVTDSACGHSVSLAPGVGDFSCSQLAGCSIHNIGDVDATLPLSGDCGKGFVWNSATNKYVLRANDTFTNIGVVDKSGSYAAEPFGFYFKAPSVGCAVAKAYSIGFVEDSWTAITALQPNYVTTVTDPLSVKRTWDGHLLFKGLCNSVSSPATNALADPAGTNIFTLPVGFLPTVVLVRMDMNIVYSVSSPSDTPITLAGYVIMSGSTGVVTFYCNDGDAVATASAITALANNNAHGFSFNGKAIYQ